jgi:ornithine carbamoyltransferase
MLRSSMGFSVAPGVALPPELMRSLLAGARACKTAGAAARPLKDRHVAMLCEAPGGAWADAFAAAAVVLGAKVVQIRPSALGLLDATRSPAEADDHARQTAHMLGRLYSAIGVGDLAAPAFALLARWAGVPVLRVLADDTQATRLLADLLTLREQVGSPGPPLVLGLPGGAHSRLARAWRQLVELDDVQLVLLGPPGQAPLQAAWRRCQFAYRPGAPAVLLALDHERGQHQDLQEQQLIHHRLVLQALLSSIITA